MIKILDNYGDVLMTIDEDSLIGADLSCSNLRNADLSGSNLSGADLSGSNLIGADLSGSSLSGADLSGSDLSGSNLSGSNLRNADLSGSNLIGADLSGSNLSGADLSGSDIIIITWGWWTTYITKGHIRIGCKSYTLQEWKNFSDEEINKMDSRAIKFCEQNKELIIGLCERFETNKGEETK